MTAKPSYGSPGPEDEYVDAEVEQADQTDPTRALRQVDEPEDVTEEIAGLPTVLHETDRAAIDVAVATAHKYKRSVTKAVRDAKTLATMTQKTAESMIYAVKRGNKIITGPSARLAEVLGSSWGNLRVDADIVGEDKRFITIMSTAFDLEKNFAVRLRVRRRITDKNGHTFNDDMIGVTSNAAISIGVRNAIFKVIPRSIVDVVYEAAKGAATGKGTIEQKRTAAGKYWEDQGVTEPELFAALQVKGWEDIGEDELVTLRGFVNAIREKEQTVDDIFRPVRESTATAGLNAALGVAPSTAMPTAATDGKTDDDLAADDAATVAEDKKREANRRGR